MVSESCASVLIPTITNIVYLFLTSGQFHPIVKESVISPVLKKPTLLTKTNSPTTEPVTSEPPTYVSYQK